jgi:hypothetical protein
MEFTRAINLMSGEVITITEKEFQAVSEAIQAKEEWIRVQGQLINTKAIAKIGNHHATAEMKKMSGANLDRALMSAGRLDILEAKRKMVKDKAMKENEKDKDFERRLIGGDPEAIRVYNAMPDERRGLMTAEESARGDAEYWVDDLGEKHFS